MLTDKRAKRGLSYVPLMLFPLHVTKISQGCQTPRETPARQRSDYIGTRDIPTMPHSPPPINRAVMRSPDYADPLRTENVYDGIVGGSWRVFRPGYPKIASFFGAGFVLEFERIELNGKRATLQISWEELQKNRVGEVVKKVVAKRMWSVKKRPSRNSHFVKQRGLREAVVCQKIVFCTYRFE